MIKDLLGKGMTISVMYLETLGNAMGPNVELTADAHQAIFRAEKSNPLYIGEDIGEITVTLTPTAREKALAAKYKAVGMVDAKVSSIIQHTVEVGEGELSLEEADALVRGKCGLWYASIPNDAAALSLIDEYNIVDEITKVMKERKEREKAEKAAEARRIRMGELAKKSLQETDHARIRDEIIREASGVDLEIIKPDPMDEP